MLLWGFVSIHGAFEDGSSQDAHDDKTEITATFLQEHKYTPSTIHRNTVFIGNSGLYSLDRMKAPLVFLVASETNIGLKALIAIPILLLIPMIALGELISICTGRYVDIYSLLVPNIYLEWLDQLLSDLSQQEEGDKPDTLTTMIELTRGLFNILIQNGIIVCSAAQKKQTDLNDQAKDLLAHLGPCLKVLIPEADLGSDSVDVLFGALASCKNCMVKLIRQHGNDYGLYAEIYAMIYGLINDSDSEW